MEKEIKIFEDYLNGFDMNNEMILFKYKHTYRVVDNAKKIAKSLDLNENEYNRACIAALFHDIGRFPQAKEYNTFSDRKSFDHGDKGSEILKELNYNDDIVIKAVKYHNKYDFPKFDDLTDMHIKIVRDADKIDIMHVTYAENIDRKIKISNRIINCFKKHKQLPNYLGHSYVIYLLRILAFIFDINYKKSMEMILKNGSVQFVFSKLKTRLDKEIYDLIEAETKKYIKERFDIIC